MGTRDEMDRETENKGMRKMEEQRIWDREMQDTGMRKMEEKIWDKRNEKCRNEKDGGIGNKD
jgi:hypothetical protein